MSNTTRINATAALLLATGLLLTGCGDDAPASSAGAAESATASTSVSSSPTEKISPSTSAHSTSPTPAPSSPSGPTVAVTIKGDTVTPNGQRIKATVGEPLVITVDSDRAGELHVHSTPEQEPEYTEGTTTLKVRIDKPGIVDIEDHIADVVIVQLEVS